MANLFPVLTPLSMDMAHPFPFIPNLGHALVFDLEREGDGKPMSAFLRLPSSMPRFVQLPERAEKQVHFIRIEEVIERFITRFFPNHKINGYGNFRVIRDSDLELQEEAEDLVMTFETALKRRRPRRSSRRPRHHHRRSRRRIRRRRRTRLRPPRPSCRASPFR